MASHHLQPTIRPRSLAHVLDDLREARSDMDAARTAVIGGEDADDRLAEAETRMEDLQEEFDERLLSATGLSVEQVRDAYSEALI